MRVLADVRINDVSQKAFGDCFVLGYSKLSMQRTFGVAGCCPLNPELFASSQRKSQYPLYKGVCLKLLRLTCPAT
jgi:hypothetical protein